MDETKLEIPLLQSEEKVVGSAFLTQDEEVIFTPHPDTIEVVLVQPQPGSSGPWAVRRRPIADTWLDWRLVREEIPVGTLS